ncbi:hypothetical protein P7K49_027900 [Saguinus oedipus]|uniref:Uncharacterized protein n=1 Tax=Saguinus oedipus TaxID=9490 RepID=A0ABQ9UD02_SAGOE|nr:hypothetical protein P7K49_027900 [Saguinus oedipus]
MGVGTEARSVAYRVPTGPGCGHGTEAALGVTVTWIQGVEMCRHGQKTARKDTLSQEASDGTCILFCVLSLMKEACMARSPQCCVSEAGEGIAPDDAMLSANPANGH